MMFAAVLFVLVFIAAVSYAVLPLTTFVFLLALSIIIPTIFYMMWRDTSAIADTP